MNHVSIRCGDQWAEAIRSSRPIQLVDDINGLRAITQHDVALVVWQRSLLNQVSKWIAELSYEQLPHTRLLVRPQDLVNALTEHVISCGMPACKSLDLLVEDIDALVKAFADLTGSDNVDVRLERVNHDACRKFHRDRVETRLVTTYMGPATQWVQPQHADAALQLQSGFDGPLVCLETSDVAIFKGNITDAECGIVHRSPPIAKSGATRLLLCLNAPSVVSPQLWPSKTA